MSFIGIHVSFIVHHNRYIRSICPIFRVPLPFEGISLREGALGEQRLVRYNFLAIKKEILPFAKTWMDLEGVMYAK